MRKEDNPPTKVVAIRTRNCPKGEIKHVSILFLDGGGEVGEHDAMFLMDAGRDYFMIPPPGSPAHAAHVKTGLPLLLQTRVCPQCSERVLFA